MPKAVLESVEGCPKYCPECGRQGLCINSRREPGAVMRRYKCTCRRRWTTLEMMADDGGKHGKVKHFLRQRHNAELIRQQALEGLRLDLDLALTRFSHACAS